MFGEEEQDKQENPVDDNEMEFDQPAEQPNFFKSLRLNNQLNVTAMRGQLAQVLGDLDRQSFASRMDRGTIATRVGRDTLYQLKNRDDIQAVDLFERYQREETIGRDARLMSIALNKTYKRLSMRYIGDRVGTLYKPGATQSFKQRRDTIMQSVKIINKFMPPDEMRVQERKDDIRRERAKVKLNKLSSPMYLTNFCVACPVLILLFSVLLFTAAAVFGYISGHFELKPAHYRETYIWDDDAMIEWDMQEAAKMNLLGSSNLEVPIRIQLLDKMTAQIMYEGETGEENLLEKQYLLEIAEFEKEIKDDESWAKLCWSGSDDGTCNEKAFMSPVSFLKGQGDLASMDQKTINDIWWQYFHDKNAYLDSVNQFYNGLLYPHRETIAAQGKITHMRTIINFGAPLDIDGVRYKDTNDRKSEQFKFIKDFQWKMYWQARNKKYQDFDAKIKPQFYSTEVQNQETKEQSMKDTMYICLSVIFVFLWLCFHLRSSALSLISMLVVAFSFGTTGLLCEYAVGMTYFNILNNFAIFIILGIAADDFFIFFDAWNQSGEYKGLRKDHQRRMAYTMRRAARTMFMTSSTTAVAFLATCFSPIMTVRAFGIYSAILVPMNFILTCWILPPAVILYERLNTECFCCLRINTSKSYATQETEVGETHRNVLSSSPDKEGESPKTELREQEAEQKRSVLDNEPELRKSIPGSNKQDLEFEGGEPSEGTYLTDDGDFEEGEVTKLSDLESFFGGFWNRHVYNCRVLIIFAFIIWTVFAVSKAISIKPLAKQETLLPSNNILLQAKDQMQVSFPTLPTEYTNENEITFYFGVDSIDKSAVNKWDPSDLGSVQWATDFDLSSVESQESLKEFCRDLKTAEFILGGQVSCWYEQFEAYLAGLSTPLTLPISSPADFNKQLLDFAKTPVGLNLAQQSTLIIVDDKLKYFEIKATSRGRAWEEQKGNKDVYASCYNFIMGYINRAPTGLKSAKYAAEQFAQKATEKALQDFAIWGIIISLCFAFLILLLIVCNVIIAFISVVCVGIIASSVIAVMVFQGYELVVGESVSMIILTGLAVDYVIHLAQSYVFSPHKHRSRKIKHAYQEMGVSIFSGLITTVGAAAFLFFGKIVLFEKFAVIIVSTCCFSFLTAMLFFGAAMHLFGPQNGWGNLIVCDSCYALNPEGEDAKIREMEEQLEREEALPKNIYEMMQDGEMQRSLDSHRKESVHSENVDV